MKLHLQGFLKQERVINREAITDYPVNNSFYRNMEGKMLSEVQINVTLSNMNDIKNLLVILNFIGPSLMQNDIKNNEKLNDDLAKEMKPAQDWWNGLEKHERDCMLIKYNKMNIFNILEIYKAENF